MEQSPTEHDERVLQLVAQFHAFNALLDQRNKGRERRGENPLRFDPFHGQGRILRALADHDGTTQAELAELLGITPQTLSISLKKLVRDELVEQEPSELDRRAKTLHLTAAGAEIKEGLEERAKYSGSMFEAFSDEEAGQFGALLEKLCTHLRSEIEIADLNDQLTAGTSVIPGKI